MGKFRRPDPCHSSYCSASLILMALSFLFRVLVRGCLSTFHASAFAATMACGGALLLYTQVAVANLIFIFMYSGSLGCVHAALLLGQCTGSWLVGLQSVPLHQCLHPSKGNSILE